MVYMSKEELHYMSEFEKHTKVFPLYCICKGNVLNFLVEEKDFPRAIGKKGMNIKRMEKLFKKKINVLKNSNDLKDFVQNIIYPLKIYKLSDEKDKIFIIIDKKSAKNRKLLFEKKDLLKILLKNKYKKEVKVI